MESHVFQYSTENTRSNNQAYQTYGILQGVINGTGENNYKTSSTGKAKDRRDINTKINQKFVTYNVDVPISKSSSLN